MEAQERLRGWAEKTGHLIRDAEWALLKPVSAATAEHEVRYRAADHRAVKRTWPGTFGFIPGKSGGNWMPKPASPREYLQRQALQNEFFMDDIRLEGVMLSDGPSMIIGQAPGGISLVISQPWLDAANPSQPHPKETQIAEFMHTMGFFPLFGSLFGWMREDDSCVILDAKPDNFIFTAAGILPIDLLITEITPPE